METAQTSSFFRGTTAPKSQDRLKRLLTDDSTGGLVISKALFTLNPWHYSSEEPRTTEAVAARWHYRGPCG